MTQSKTSKATGATAEASELQPPAFACSHCPDCGYNNFPPADVCPKCWSEHTQLQALSSEGVLYSFSTIGGADAAQFVGYVDLPENVRVFGLLNTAERPECGMPVRLSAVRAPGSGPSFVFDVLAKQEA
jgi:uncharacterized OB-fold protein